MRPSVFHYDDYKVYLNEVIPTLPKGGRGIKLKMAEVMNCQSGFITQVLSGSAHFSAEQLESLNGLLEHTALESEFFLFLLHHQRAGTQQLRQFYRQQLDRILVNELNVTKSIHTKEKLEGWEQEIYYSQWYYIAIHMAVTIPSLQTVDALCERLSLPRALILRALEFLKKAELVAEKDGRLVPGRTIIHLSSDSAHITKHHTHSRLRAIESASYQETKDMHYSSVITMSKEDFEQLKVVFLDFLKKTRSLINESKEEEIYGFNLDLFRFK